MITISQILPYAAALFNVDVPTLLSSSRRREYVETRIALSAVGHTLGLSAEQITDPLNRDRTCFYHYRLTHPLLFESDEHYRRRAQILLKYAQRIAVTRRHYLRDVATGITELREVA